MPLPQISTQGSHKRQLAMKFLVLIWAVFLFFGLTTSETETYNLIHSTNLTKPGCESRCGDLIVPYPFGIGTNCSLGERFNIYCNKSVNPPKGSITEQDHSWIKLISDSTLRTSNLVAKRCSFPDGSWSTTNITSDYSRNFPYTISEVNKFTVIGCGSYAWLTSAAKNRTVSTGCMVFCSKPDEVAAAGDECSGNGCCESSIPQNINYYKTQVDSLTNSGNVSFAPCTYAFVGEENVFKFKGISDLRAIDRFDNSFKDMIEDTVPIVLDWALCSSQQNK
ncbi:putative wall-associated receptor kinase, galacturonan-binding domain-containing protein [Helianthus annuus]|nr:putative wall-associated receptor kinase, galacturonan-binding domain-containing protein [Helianthus annuus]KAJ0878693.1 putative wall-associated receptor kinase, galacturonan-binding domain-containing protein [Helianthus annuus]